MDESQFGLLGYPAGSFCKRVLSLKVMLGTRGEISTDYS